MNRPTGATHVNTSYDKPIFLRAVKNKLQIWTSVTGDKEIKWRDCQILKQYYLKYNTKTL